MKWVKFLQDFNTSPPLTKLLSTGQINLIPENNNNSIIHIPNKPYEAIDKSFRIYNLTPNAFDTGYLARSAATKRPDQFHLWHFEKCLPPACFDPKYFDPKLVILHPYEIYVGGWVEFFDTEVRHGNTDHALYFEWDHTAKSVTTYILQTIPNVSWNFYINITPPTSTDPPPPKSGKPPY
jgi:hypothetical protein